MKTQKTVNARKGEVNRSLSACIAGRKVWVDRKTGHEVPAVSEEMLTERLNEKTLRYFERVNGPHHDAKWAKDALRKGGAL